MFTTLHAMAQGATLMIAITAEGADQLRVNVTPLPADPKSKANLPQPLSLVATPAEFDADFGTALANWQAPRRSLIQQVQDATASETPAGPAATPKKDKPQRHAGTRKKGSATEQEPGGFTEGADLESTATNTGSASAPAAAPGAGDGPAAAGGEETGAAQPDAQGEATAAPAEPGSAANCPDAAGPASAATEASAPAGGTTDAADTHTLNLF